MDPLPPCRVAPTSFRPLIAKGASVRKMRVNGNSQLLPSFHAVCSRKKKKKLCFRMFQVCSFTRSSIYPSALAILKQEKMPGILAVAVRSKPTNLAMKLKTFYVDYNRLHINYIRFGNSIPNVLGDGTAWPSTSSICKCPNAAQVLLPMMYTISGKTLQFFSFLQHIRKHLKNQWRYNGLGKNS